MPLEKRHTGERKHMQSIYFAASTSPPYEFLMNRQLAESGDPPPPIIGELANHDHLVMGRAKEFIFLIDPPIFGML
jgi:hypothetical protein